MKKKTNYTSPVLEIEYFRAEDIVTVSLGDNDFDNDNDGDYPNDWD